MGERGSGKEGKKRWRFLLQVAGSVLNAKNVESMSAWQYRSGKMATHLDEFLLFELALNVGETCRGVFGDGQRQTRSNCRRLGR